MENLNLNLPPFYVGQKVVYIGNILTKNSIHTVKDIKMCTCGCWCVDVGVQIDADDLAQFYHCPEHGRNHLIKKPKHTTLFKSTSFAPLEERFISFAEVIEIESPLIGAN